MAAVARAEGSEPRALECVGDRVQDRLVVLHDQDGLGGRHRPSLAHPFGAGRPPIAAVSSAGDDGGRRGRTAVTAPLQGERYRLDELIGRGGMASVWRATDTVLGRPVAVKRLHPGLIADEEHAERFRREALLVARLSHPNLVRLLDRGEDADGPYLVMELVDGENLKSLVRREGALPPEEAVRICVEVGRALAYAHAQGVVHRDIKAQNVLLTARRRRQAHRLRHRPADGGRRGAGTHPHGHARGQRGLPLPGAGRRAAGRRAAPTSTRSGSCSTSASRAACPSRARASWPWPCVTARSRCPTRARSLPAVPGWLAAARPAGRGQGARRPLPRRRRLRRGPASRSRSPSAAARR